MKEQFVQLNLLSQSRWKEGERKRKTFQFFSRREKWKERNSNIFLCENDWKKKKKWSKIDVKWENGIEVEGVHWNSFRHACFMNLNGFNWRWNKMRKKLKVFWKWMYRECITNVSRMYHPNVFQLFLNFWSEWKLPIEWNCFQYALIKKLGLIHLKKLEKISKSKSIEKWMYPRMYRECATDVSPKYFFKMRSESTLPVDRKLFRNTQSTKLGLIHSQNQKKLSNINYFENECTSECIANVPLNVLPKKKVPEMYRERAIECNTHFDCWEEIEKEAPRWMETLREHQIHQIGIDS